MTDTRSRLIGAALAILREEGLGAASARTIATRAEANQALVFYHFHTVNELLEAASDQAVDASVDHYRQALGEAESLSDLLGIARELHDRERRNGNIAVMAQLMAGAQHDPVLARASQHAMTVWTREITVVLDRLLASSPVADLLDTEGLAHVISAGFIGLELYDGVDTTGASRARDTLEGLAQLLDVVNQLGPVARRALRSQLGGAVRR
jgi:AcrR family transcriptional regulator